MPIVKGPRDHDAKALEPTVKAKVPAKGQELLERIRSGDTYISDPLIGTSLSMRYKILERIGQGGMGTVYLAEDTRIGKKVAVKVLPEYIGKMTNIAERFVQEAKLAPRIDHENIIDVTDLGKTKNGVPFFVMEYLKGSDLAGVITREGLMGWNERTKEILLQICRGLSAAHDKGIVHRDMKPENVFLVERSDNRIFIKLFDFGIAKLIEKASDEKEHGGAQVDGSISGKLGVTQAGSVMGTPNYMAPEQASGQSVDQRVDVYALGIIMYEMICGRVPFELEVSEGPAADAYKILDMQKNKMPIPPRTRRPDLDIPLELEAIIMKALAKNREERFSSMKEMESAVIALNVPTIEPQPQSVNSSNGQALIRTLRVGSKSATGYLEITKMEMERKKRNVRRAVAVTLLATVIASSVTGKVAYDYYENHLHHTQDSGNNVQKRDSLNRQMPALDNNNGREGK